MCTPCYERRVPGADAEEDVAEEDEGAGDERSEGEDGDALAHGPLPGVLVEAAELHDDNDGDGKEAHDEGVVPTDEGRRRVITYVSIQ